MKKYDSYKDSGIEWIGEIPSHWDVNKLFRLFKINTGFTPSTTNSKFYDNGIYDWINISDLESKYVSTSKTKLTDIAVQGKEIVPKGSLLYSFKLSVGKMAFADKDLYTNEAIFSIYPDDNINLNYYYYLLDRILIHNSNENIYGAKILNQELIKASKLIVPSKIEQTTIANYLDQKTTQIDDLIAKKERLIQLLEEERTAIINQAVTKGLPAEERLKAGLDPNVPMKDSGVEWLGEIPAHWEVILFKRVISKIKDGTHGTFQRIPAGYPFLSAKNVYNDGLKISETESLISENDYLNITKNGFPKKNDLLITCVGTIGRTFVYDLNEPMAFQRSVTFIRFNDNINPHYYKFYVQSPIYQNLLISIAKTSAQSGIYMNDLVNTYALKIPLHEQTEIVEFLKTKTFEIDEIILKTQHEIELLKEYKTALISEVVTGKLDVRDEKLN